MRNSFSRRQFLGAIGLTLGFAGMGAMSSLASSEIQSLGNLGLILPESKCYPKIASELIDGLTENLPKSQQVSRLKDAKLENLERFAKSYDTLIMYASPSSAYRLRQRINADAAQVIAIDLGMDIQRFGETLPRLNYLSLSYWQLAQALALWVKENLGERILIVTDSYESGYDSFSLFESHFPAAKIMIYKEETLSQFMGNESFSAIAFALTGEKAQAFIAEYEASGLQLPLLSLPSVGNTIQSSRPIYSASFAFDESPFYSLGQRTAQFLLGQNCDEMPIVIKAGQLRMAQYLGSQLPYHGINNLVKTGWTNPYPI